ncbi:MAG: 2,3-bisphosphoglycerate-independent phosphoglycerate mutase [Clostridiales bacterium]|nr:2,3-bisphosphoglycerate-independent phosphoglycerate mutase [Clostridiales bacterium]
MKQTTMLMILDGFGVAPACEGNAICRANKPTLDRLFAECPNVTLTASGRAVGLPDGQAGNSEVGHMNMGAGRIVYQNLTLIDHAIETGEFFKNPALNDVMDHVLANDSTLHLMGLLSDGGVHSQMTHLFAIIDLAAKKGVKDLAVHCFLDGRDVPPQCAEKYILQLEEYLEKAGLGRIALISGRFYAMDRDKRWERVQVAYDAMTLGLGRRAARPVDAVTQAYANEETDEFVVPTVIAEEGKVPVLVDDNDGMIFFNFRADRAREITRAFVDEGFDGFARTKKVQGLRYVCMTEYDAEMPNVHIAFPPQSLKNTLGEYLASLDLRQLRIAETEKYAHVTFFFNGSVEAPNKGEDRILIDSPKVPTYDMQPEMSAFGVTERVVDEIRGNQYDAIILNYANPDMVGHTGCLPAAVQAVEALDQCVAKVLDALDEVGGKLIITADHGNADRMLDEGHDPVTSHSDSRVPFLVRCPEKVELREGGILADVAPTMLALMGLPQPAEMTGKSLLK